MDELVSAARTVVVGGSSDDVVAGVRQHVEPGTRAEVLQFSGGLSEAERRSSPVYEVLRLTYRSGYSPDEIAEAEESLGLLIPSEWAEYLTGPSVFVGGWLETGAYFGVFSPKDIAEVTNAYFEWVPSRGAIMIADDGGGSWLQLDTGKGNDTPVLLAYSSSAEWSETKVQCNSIQELIARIESRRFEFDDYAPDYRS